MFLFRYLNDVEIKDDDHFKVSNKPEEHLFRIDIVEINEDHCGKIRVVGKNENGEDAKEVKLNNFCLMKLNFSVIK